MEASTGIEPVYTDLQSLRFHNKNNAVSLKKYQDKCRTQRELDTTAKIDRAKKNPGAAATATGAESNFEAAKLHKDDTPETTVGATFFWCKASGSVERFTGYPRGVAV